MAMTLEQQRAEAEADAARRAAEAQSAPPAPQQGPPLSAKQQPSYASDILQSAGAGLRQGIEGIGGAMGDASQSSGDVASWLAQKFGLSPETAETIGGVAKHLNPWGGMMPTTSDVQSLTNPVVGQSYQPQTTPGQFSKTVASFLPAALGGEGSLPARLLNQVILPGVGSEAAGQLTSGTDAEPYARIAGAVVGGLTPSALRRVISPLPNSPEREALAQTLANEGVDLTAGQRTGRTSLRYAESELGGGAGQRMMDRQGEQFTQAALRRIGEDAPRATPEVLDRAYTRIGGQFDQLAARNTLVPDRQLMGDLRATVGEYGNLVPESARAPIVQNVTNDIVDSIRRNGQMTGDVYQAVTSRLAKAARGTSDPELGQALRGMRSALDDAMGRSIAANNPADTGAWQTARTQYRNFLAIEQAATGAGENAAAGIISPSALRNATVTKQGRRNYARGQGDFADLARAGEGVMKPLPNSGTAARTAVRNVGIPSASAGVGGLVAGLPGAIAGAAIPYAAGRALLSAPVRAYLGNQAATNLPVGDPRIAALIASLLNRPTSAPQISR